MHGICVGSSRCHKHAEFVWRGSERLPEEQERGHARHAKLGRKFTELVNIHALVGTAGYGAVRGGLRCQHGAQQVVAMALIKRVDGLDKIR